MDSNTIKVVTVPVGDLLSMITNAVNTEIEKLVNNPRLGENFKDEVLDRKQAAELLKLSEQTLTKLFLEGKLVGQKSGAQYRFLKSSIVTYLSTRIN
jgi:excisionase family DNA binding protein